MEPAGYDGTPRPLLVTLHGMGGDAWDGIAGFDRAGNRRGWLVASPDTHGENDPTGANSLAARAAQHDVLDLVDYCAAHWAVDPDRVYLTGGSMGGMATTIIAARYADRFAAAVEWFGPADLFVAWDELWWGSFRANMVSEIGGDPGQEPWEYTRRSPIHDAPNLRHLPFAIGQGRLDFVVLPHHSRDLDRAIRRWQPDAYGGIYWNWGAHFLFPGDYERTLAFLAGHVRQGDPPDVLLRSDEDQALWWVAVRGAVPDRWRSLAAWPEPGANRLVLVAENVREAAVEVGRAGLDRHSPLEVTWYADVDGGFVLAGLDPALGYTVERGGMPWPRWSWDPVRGLLRVDVAAARTGPPPFVIR